MVVVTILHELRQVELSALSLPLWVAGAYRRRFLLEGQRQLFSKDALFFLFDIRRGGFSESALTENRIFFEGASTGPLDLDESVLARAVIDAHGDLPEGDEGRVEAVLDAGLVTAQDLRTMFLQEVCKLLVQA